MKLAKLAGATSEIWQIFIRDSSSTTGAGLTGLAFNTSGLTAYYNRDTDSAPTAITLVTMTAGTFTSSGFKEISSANMPGWYQFCPPNAALASGAKSCAFHLKGATNMAPLPIEVQLTAVDLDNATSFGLSRLDAAISSRSTLAAGAAMTLTAAYDAAKTASQAGDAMALTSAERNSTADALLGRNVAGGSSAGRLVKEALYVLRNKTDISAGTLTVYQTDDTTSAFTATVQTTAGNPISQIDPA